MGKYRGRHWTGIALMVAGAIGTFYFVMKLIELIFFGGR